MNTHKQQSISLQQETLAATLAQALRREAFSNRMLIAPRQLDQIGEKVAVDFLGFLEAEDVKTVQAYGQQLALEGLGHRSLLLMIEALRQACWENTNITELLSVSGRYANALLEGYMTGREEDLLREQERTRRAFQRAHKA